MQGISGRGVGENTVLCYAVIITIPNAWIRLLQPWSPLIEELEL